MQQLTKVFFIFLMVFGVQNVVVAKPSRVKRVSDSHLADLETRIGLSKMDNKVAITIPVTSLIRNPMEIGRKRRSQSRMMDVLFNQSEEDNPADYDYFYNLLKYQ